MAGFAGIELSGLGVCVYGVVDLVITALVQGAKVEPDFGDIRADVNGTGVSIEGVAVLVDLEVEHADGAPEGRVAAVAVHGLLVGLICLVVLLTGHVCAPKKIPALSISSPNSPEAPTVNLKTDPMHSDFQADTAGMSDSKRPK